MYFLESFPCRSLFDKHQAWGARYFFIYANVETKQDHVKVVSFAYSLVEVVSFTYPLVSFTYSFSRVVSLVRVVNFAYSLESQ